ncbi:ankyrin repeat domain-containing protein [Endozoicomonas sp. SM1973]|uniref:Ankyrin repeat domain-containing protein n=2 Tax=Spartinivicinus marinus TaxID=2994442 RepID=A0A853I9T6_9GAMM|nr:ankyrin repeat domain-containing protein [Spartinivicinus marinus]MCX4026961.1 ankyrin repeat domain-containing protein [Spartinivicinus marinus]NYZ70043.1 ankyrin repeat domain-containing protein [Spartinivicinus marinus]
MTYAASSDSDLIQSTKDKDAEAVSKHLNEGESTANKEAALLLATMLGFDTGVALLLEFGTDENIIDKEGNTLLAVASFYNHAGIAKMLINKGADINAKPFEGISPLMLASSKNNIEVIKVLVDKGVNINFNSNSDKATALMVAAQNGHFETVKFLVESGAKTEMKDSKGSTALDFALWQDHLEIATYLDEIRRKLKNKK